MSAPKLRFKEFDKAFSRNTIKELAKIYVGRDLVEDAYSPVKTETHIYPIYSNSVDNEGLYGYYNFEEFNFDDGALTVVGRGAGLGKAFYRQGGFGTIGRLLSLTPKDKSFHPKYLSDYINDKLIIHNESGGIPQLPRSSLENYEVVLPSYEEQTKIASFLSAVDEKISQLTQKHELLSQYKQGMMQKLFSQQIRFKADDGSEFGEWEEIQLRDVAERVTRKNKEDNQNALTISAQMGLVNQQDYFSKQIASRDLSKYYLLHKGEFAYNKSYSAGYPMGAIKRLKLYEKGVVSTLYICFALNDQLNANFFEQYVESGALVPELEKIAQEGARNHGLLNISLQEFFEVVILKPCLEEQTKIANFLSAIDQKIEVVAQQIEQAKIWKKGLLQQMFL